MSFSNSLIHTCGFLLVLGSALASPMTETPSASNACDLIQSPALSTTETSNHTPRTVWSILWSCISTIIACCWVAVHPNMLGPDATLWQSTIQRLKHMFWMIIAPELMICWAIRQWVGARNLLTKAPYDKAQPSWTKTHGFFLQMGGFVLHGKNSENDILSAKQLESLVEQKAIALPNITARDIKDRSKRDGLSKTIAIGQTTWFLAQCITRKAQGLVTTELELVTVAFAALNVFIYYFWWDKPMDVQTTVTLPYLVKANAKDRGLDKKGQSRGVSESLVPTQLEPTSPRRLNRRQRDQPSTKHPKPSVLDPPAKNPSFLQIICRSILAFIALPFTGIITLFDRIGSMLFESPLTEPGKKQIFTFYALPTSEKQQNIILTCVGLVGVLFGGIHCVGWNYFFPSHREVTIWRVSSVFITIVPALLALGVYSLYKATEFKDGGSRKLSDAYEIVGMLFLVLATVGVIPYLIARVLLLIEAFISLRDLPPGALLAVRWTSFLPHF